MSDNATIEVKTGFLVFAFFFFACTPRIEIDGVVHLKPWGRHKFTVTPGDHQVKIYFRYLFLSHCGENTISVKLEPGETCQLKYWMPPWMFCKGTLKKV
jgi:hypothetical protein